MDCTIVIKKKGQLKYDWTGTIKEAIKDWDVYYRAVFNHVKDCDKCDPDDVLRAYWELRQSPKHEGRTSVGLAALAYRYRRIGADIELVKLFIARSGDVIKYSHLFEDEELYKIIIEDIHVKFERAGLGNKWPILSAITDIKHYLKKKHRPFLLGVSHVFEAGLMPPYADVERLAVVAEVTVS